MSWGRSDFDDSDSTSDGRYVWHGYLESLGVNLDANFERTGFRAFSVSKALPLTDTWASGGAKGNFGKQYQINCGNLHSDWNGNAHLFTQFSAQRNKSNQR